MKQSSLSQHYVTKKRGQMPTAKKPSATEVMGNTATPKRAENPKL
jgi:hypothetical protein